MAATSRLTNTKVEFRRRNLLNWVGKCIILRRDEPIWENHDTPDLPRYSDFYQPTQHRRFFTRPIFVYCLPPPKFGFTTLLTSTHYDQNTPNLKIINFKILQNVVFDESKFSEISTLNVSDLRKEKKYLYGFYFFRDYLMIFEVKF